MATTKPTFQNKHPHPIDVPRYNLSSISVPPNLYVTGAYYLEENTLVAVDSTRWIASNVTGSGWLVDGA